MSDIIKMLLQAEIDTTKSITKIKSQIKDIENQVGAIKLDIKTDSATTGVKDISSQIKNIDTGIIKANVSTKQFNNSLKDSKGFMTSLVDNAYKFARFYIIGQGIVNVVNAVRDGVSAVKDLDGAMVELKKVTDEAESTYQQFTKTAFELGKELGRTGIEVVNATADFARMGYNLREATILAQEALLMVNVGDGVENLEQATSSMIATLKGFEVASENTTTYARHINDVYNEISNSFATDTGSLAQGVQRASAVLNQAGVSFEQTVAMLTGAYEVLQNMERSSVGLTTISQRLRGIGEDGSTIDGLAPKMEEDFNALGLTLKDTNGQIKDTYTILGELAEVYPTLTANQKAYIGELVSGKNRAQVLQAILSNWDNVEKATETTMNSMGSAIRENEIYLESIEGKMKQLESTSQMFWVNFINTDTIKNYVTALTELVEVLDKLINSPVGSFVTQVALLSGGILLLKKGVTLLGASFAKTAIGATVMTAASGGLLAAVKALTITMLTNPIFLGATAFVGVITLIQNHQTALEKLKETTAELNTEISSLESELASLSSIEETDRTAIDNARIQILEREIALKRENLAINAEAILQEEYLANSIKSTGKNRWEVSNTSGAKLIQKDIDALVKLRKEMENVNNTDTGFKELEADALELEQALLGTLGELLDLVEVSDNVDDGILALVNSLKEVLGITDKTPESINGVDNSFINLSGNIKLTQEQLDELTKQFDDATNNMNTYKSMLDELNSKEGLSAKSKQDIITKYQELLPYLSDEQALKKELMRLHDEEAEVARQATIKKLVANEDFWNVSIDGNSQLVNAINDYYNTDFDNFKSLADAKGKVEAELISQLAGMWAEYYRIISDGMSPGSLAMMRMMEQQAEAGVEGAKQVLDTQRQIATMKNDLANIALNLGGISFKGVGTSKKSSGSSSKSSTDSRNFLESIDAEIRAIKIRNDGLIKTADLLKEQMDAIDTDTVEGLNEKYELTGKLIEHNNKIIQSFKEEQDAVHQRANQIREQYSKYNIDSWFDSNAEQTTAYIEQYNKATKTQQEEMDKVFGQVQQLKKAWMDSNSEIKNTNGSIKELTLSQTELNAKIDEMLQKQYEADVAKWIKEQNDLYDDQQDRLQALEQIQEQIVAIIRKRGEEEKKALDEAHQKEMDSLEERHETRMQGYKDELDEFNKMIQAKIDALDEQYEEEDYLEQLNKEREEANRLQAEIDVLSLDDSLTARNKTIELRKQLADQNEKIAKMQQKKERDTLKKSLEDQLKDKEKQTKDIEKIADNSYNNEKRRLEEDYRINKEYLEKKYSDEQVYAEARESIMRGEVEVAEGVFMDIYDAFEDFEDKFGKGMGILGDIIKNDFINQLKLAQDAIDEMDYKASNLRQKYDSDYVPKESEVAKPKRPSKEDSTSSGGKIYMSSSDFNKYINYKLIYDMAKSAGNKAGMDSARAGAQSIRDKYGIVSDKYSYDDLKNRSYKDVGFVNGGKITETGTLIAPFHGRQDSPEWIFNDEQLKKIIQEVSISSFKMAIPKIPNISGGRGSSFQIDHLIHIEGNVDEKVLPKLQKAGNDIAETLKNLNKGGIFRPVKV